MIVFNRSSRQRRAAPLHGLDGTLLEIGSLGICFREKDPLEKALLELDCRRHAVAVSSLVRAHIGSAWMAGGSTPVAAGELRINVGSSRGGDAACSREGDAGRKPDGNAGRGPHGTESA